MLTRSDQGAGGRRFHYAQGKNPGDSSGRNQLIYNRGTKDSYGLWADEVGDDAYRWENMLPFFDKTVTFTPPNPETLAANASAAKYSGSTFANSDGPLQLMFPLYTQPISSYSPAAFAAAGMPAGDSFVVGELDGYGYWISTIDAETGLRSSSETAFLWPALSSSQLTVYQSCQAQKMRFDGDNKATGVDVRQYGLPAFKLTARREVVLAAGVVRI